MLTTKNHTSWACKISNRVNTGFTQFYYNLNR